MSFLGRPPTNAPLTSADIPDGIVAAADLAPNSVDSSELVDGSIDTSHLSSSLTLTTPNLGTVTAGNLSNTAIVYPAGHVLAQALLQDQKAWNAQSGTFTSGDWRLRDITTEVFDPQNIVTISSNKFTLIAGSYIVKWQCPHQKGHYVATKLWNETDTAYAGNGYGTAAYGDPDLGNIMTGNSFGQAVFTIAGSKEFGIYGVTQGTTDSWGFGADFNTNTSGFSTHGTGQFFII